MNNRIHISKQLTIVFIILLLLPISAMAEGIPPLPNAFNGNVTSEGTEVPVGTEIKAFIDYQNDTIPDGSVNVSTPGYYEIYVEGTSADHQKEITFVIDNLTAVQTAEFNIYGPPPVELDLSTTGSSVRITAENTTMFNDTTNPEEKQVHNNSEDQASDEASGSLDGFTLLLTVGVLGAVFIMAKFGNKGDL